MAKKGKKIKKKGKKSSGNVLSPEEEKKEVVSVLMTKCDMAEEEVLEAYDEFHNQHEKGVISKEEFVKTRRVIQILNSLQTIKNICNFRTA